MNKYFSESVLKYNCLIGELNSLYHSASRKLGLSDSVSQILYTVCIEGDGCSLEAVRKMSGMAKQTLNSAVRKMEKEKLLYLTAKDGKRKDVFLTDEGKAVVENVISRLINAENAIFAAWKESEREEYLRLTQKYIEDFALRLATL